MLEKNLIKSPPSSQSINPPFKNVRNSTQQLSNLITDQEGKNFAKSYSFNPHQYFSNPIIASFKTGSQKDSKQKESVLSNTDDQKQSEQNGQDGQRVTFAKEKEVLKEVKV